MTATPISNLPTFFRDVSLLLKEKDEAFNDKEADTADKINRAIFAKAASHLGVEKANRYLKQPLDDADKARPILETDLQFADVYHRTNTDITTQVRHFTGKMLDVCSSPIQGLEYPETTLERFHSSLPADLTDKQKAFLICSLRFEWFERASDLLKSLKEGKTTVHYESFYKPSEELINSISLLHINKKVENEALKAIDPTSRDTNVLNEQILFMNNQTANAFASLSVLAKNI